MESVCDGHTDVHDVQVNHWLLEPVYEVQNEVDGAHDVSVHH